MGFAPAGQRGPADHVARDQIVSAAVEHFRHFGYAKTSVSDVARSAGFSKANVYRFFDSKRAIGEAICAEALRRVLAAVEGAVADASTAHDRITVLFQVLATRGSQQFFDDYKLYEITAHSADEGWKSYVDYEQQLVVLITRIVDEGRRSGEFERRSSLHASSEAVFIALRPFANPLMLRHCVHQLPTASQSVSYLVIRALGADSSAPVEGECRQSHLASY